MARTIDKRIMLDLIIEAKKNDPEAGPFSEWLAEYLVDHLPTLTPPNEPLTLEQLRKMDRFSPPIYDICLNEWCCVREDACAGDIGVSYIGGGTRPLEENRFYPYPLPHINRETWTAEWKDHYRSGASAGTGFVCSSCDMWNGRKSHICPSCGKAMTEEAWEELEKRLRR